MLFFNLHSYTISSSVPIGYALERIIVLTVTTDIHLEKRSQNISQEYLLTFTC